MDSDESGEEFLSADEGEDEDVSVVTAQVEEVMVEKLEEEVCSIENAEQDNEILPRGEDNREEQQGYLVAAKEDGKSGEEIVVAENTAKEDGSAKTSIQHGNKVKNVDVSVGESAKCEPDKCVKEMIQQVPTEGEDSQEEQYGECVAVKGDKESGEEKVVEENAEEGERSAETSIPQGKDGENVTVSAGESANCEHDESVEEMVEQVPTQGELVSRTDEEPSERDVGIEDEVVSLVDVEEVGSVEQTTEVPSRPADSDDKEKATICNKYSSAGVAAEYDEIVENRSTTPARVGNHEHVGFQNEDLSLQERKIDAKNDSLGMSSDSFENDTAGNDKVKNVEMADQDLSTGAPAESYPKQAAVENVEKALPSDHSSEANECAVGHEGDKYTDKYAVVAGGEQKESPNRAVNAGSENNEGTECAEDSADLECAKGADESWDWVDNNTKTAAAESDTNHLKWKNCSTTTQDSGVLASDTGKSTDNVKPEDPVSTNKGKCTVGSPIKTTADSWGWDSWADNFISQATSKVSILMETVEGQLGIPDPSMVAQKLKEGREREKEEKKGVRDGNIIGEDQQEEENKGQGQENAESSSSSSSWFSSYIPGASTLTNLVQNKGQELVTGGIDALEFIGKSTVNYLSEGDPGLRNTRKAIMRRNKGETLSQVLEQAKLKADNRQLSDSPPKGEDPKKLGDMLEKFQGIAHLDALQMLSSNCETKLLRISKVQSDEAREDCSVLTMEIQQNFELTEAEEDHDNEADFKKDIFAANKSLKMKVTCSKLLNSWSKLKKKTENLGSENNEECFEICISSLAEFVSRCVEYYRKVADMLIMTEIEAREMSVKRAQVLKSLSEMFRSEASIIANSFANHLANNKEDKIVSDFITDIYLENENCSSLLSDSHNLLLPILQWSGIQ